LVTILYHPEVSTQRGASVAEMDSLWGSMMKKLTAATLLACAFAAGAVSAETRVGVSIGIHQPGVYGRIDIGNYPEPVLVYPQPIVVTPVPLSVYRQPIYLYVPPGHQKHWGKHCARYNACSQPVYFVRDEWVRERYEHEHERWHEGRHEGRRGHDHRQ